MEVTRVEVIFGGDIEQYDVSPGDDPAELVTQFVDLFSRSREKKLVVSITRMKGVANGD